jgi:hypothetical protein
MKKTYRGSCHCGRVRYEADIDLAAGTGRCNCTYCSKQRAWNVSIKPQDFRLTAGKEALGDYRFNTRQARHRFCTQCGLTPFGEGNVKEMGGAFVSINVACLDDVSPQELAKLPVRYADGRHDNWSEPPKVTSYL